MKKTVIATFLAGLTIFSTGCSSIVDRSFDAFGKMGEKENELTLEIERNNLSKGAALGAVVGLGAASAFTTAGGSLVAASLVGTGYFSFVGLHNDMKDEETKEFLKSKGITIEDKFEKVILTLNEDVTFDLQKTDLKDEFKPTLDGISIVLKKLKDDVTVEVVGHADYTGNDNLNNYLSNERATVVTEYLLSTGVNPEMITDYYGVSSSEPKDYCLKLSCLRRVEIIINKNDILTKIK